MSYRRFGSAKAVELKFAAKTIEAMRRNFIRVSVRRMSHKKCCRRGEANHTPLNEFGLTNR